MGDATRLNLQPERDVAIDDEGRQVAESTEPWLAVTPFDPCWAGSIVEIWYRASLLDEPMRPVFRFRQEDAGSVDRIGAGPIVGAGRWIGRVPPRSTSLSVSPTNRLGMFGFRIERVRRLSWLGLITRGFLDAPHEAWRALALRLVGFGAESDAMLDLMVSSTPMRHFPAWASSRRRAFDVDGLDRSRFDWRQSRVICIVRPGCERADLERTCTSLSDQIFPSWSAILVDSEDGRCPGDPRFESLSMTALLDRTRGWAGDEIVGVIVAGDVVTPEAFAQVAEQAQRNPSDQVFYGDLLRTRPNGSREPVFAPGWSPRLQLGRPFLDRPIFVRAGHLADANASASFFSAGMLPDTLLGGGARPLRRILAVHGPRARGIGHDPGVLSLEADHARARPEERAGSQAATIVIPTRDQAALLKRAVTSIRAKTRPGMFEIIVVNNGGSHGKTHAALASLGSMSDVSLIDYAGAFNFSAICNAGAAAGRGEVLVFLNDDTEVRSDGWLDRLIGHASHPEIGAVGAKLTYPDGRLQHIGMVLGMGGTAGHFGALDRGDAQGWASRNEVVHEVGAVTGACLAVARTKFEAVGGFDARDLPIELGDVDLCLKLRALGWQTLVDPDVRIMHAESASRGRATFRPLTVHAKERAIFRERWRHVLRDDPHFHPGLSLYSLRAALG